MNSRKQEAKDKTIVCERNKTNEKRKNISVLFSFFSFLSQAEKLFFRFAEKIFSDSVKTYQNPEKFDDKGGKVEVEIKRKNNEARARSVEQGIKQTFAFDAFGLKQNVSDDDRCHPDRTDNVIPRKIHKT